MYQTHKSYTIEEALSKLQKYCAYQDRCHKEVEQKLKQMRMIPEAIEIIVVALIEDFKKLILTTIFKHFTP